MYSTCLFCHQSLGKNEAVEHFPVGRRLAFDAAKGRLWVVCRKCERWNLTPLEERWEAIEECERAFRQTKLRVSTDHIGLARLKEGTELVRIGEPQRPEMAAWRYGDQFGRRKRRQFIMATAPGAILPFVGQLGIAAGLFGASLAAPVVYSIYFGHALYRSRALVRIATDDSATIGVRKFSIRHTRLYADGDDIRLRLPVFQPPAVPRSRFWAPPPPVDRDFSGDAALRIAAALLPHVNREGGSKHEVSRAVEYLEESSDPVRLFRRAVEAIEKREANRRLPNGAGNALSSLPVAGRLALEMATHEESERRALEGELHLLEVAWKSAEEIAGIADDMFLPPSVDEHLARLKGKRDNTSAP
jgi:hypothetical protein